MFQKLKFRAFFSILTIFVLILTLEPGYGFASTVTDSVAPVVTSITANTAIIESSAKDSLILTFDIIEEGVGVLIYRAGVKNMKTGKTYQITGADCGNCESESHGHPCFSGTHNISFGLFTLPEGEYKFTYFLVNDDAGNSFSTFDVEKYLTTDNHFTVLAGVDTQLQKIEEIKLLSDTCSASGVLKMHVVLGKTAEYNLSDMTLYFCEKGTDKILRVEAPEFMEKSGTFYLEMKLIGKGFKNAEYYLKAVNTTYCGYPDNLLIQGSELGLSKGDSFRVTGSRLNPDYSAPQLNSISFLSDSASIPGAINAAVDISEEGNGVDEIRLNLMETSTKDHISLCSYIGDGNEKAVTTGVYQCAFTVYRTKHSGSYKINSIEITDNDGNFTNYSSTSGLFDPNAIITILSPMEGDVAFTESLGHPNLLNKIKSLREGETGLIDISVEKVVPASHFKAIAGKDITLIFDFCEEYQWIINGLNIDPIKCSSANLEVHHGLTDGEDAGFAFDEKVLLMIFPDNKNLPEEMQFRINAPYLYACKGLLTDNVKLYWLNGDKTKAEKIEVEKEGDGAYVFPVSQSSECVLSGSTPALGKISNLNISALSMSSIKVSWDDNPSATGYYVYRSTSGKTGTYKKIATVKSGSSFTDRNLVKGKKYYYKVKAYNSVRSSINKTARISSAVASCTRLAAPKGLGTTSVWATEDNPQVRVYWNVVKGASRYCVYRSTSKNGIYKKIAETSKDYYVDTNIGLTQTYYYKVRAIHPSSSKYNSILSECKSGYMARFHNGYIKQID